MVSDATGSGDRAAKQRCNISTDGEEQRGKESEHRRMYMLRECPCIVK